MRLDSLALALVIFVAAAATAPVSAQDSVPPTHASVNVGLFQFDLADSGFAPMLAVRGATPINNVLLFEAALLAARPDQGFSSASTFIVPEAQVQIVLPFTAFSPYMGLGGGAALDFRPSDGGGTQANLTISGSLGIKAWLNERLGAQGEFRARGVSSEFSGTSTEYTLGLIWRI